MIISPQIWRVSDHVQFEFYAWDAVPEHFLRILRACNMYLSMFHWDHVPVRFCFTCQAPYPQWPSTFPWDQVSRSWTLPWPPQVLSVCVCVCLFVCVYMYTCMLDVWVCLCVYMCVCVCMYVCIHKHIYPDTRPFSHIIAHAHTHTCTHTHTHRLYIHAHFRCPDVHSAVPAHTLYMLVFTHMNANTNSPAGLTSTLQSQLQVPRSLSGAREYLLPPILPPTVTNKNKQDMG